MRALLAAFLIVHGIAHLVGFVVPWQLVTAADMPYRTTILAGSVDVGDAGIRMVGVMWLLLGLSFVGLGLALLSGSWSRTAAVSIVVASLVFCLFGRPEARIGLVINAIILAGVLVA